MKSRNWKKVRKITLIGFFVQTLLRATGRRSVLGRTSSSCHRPPADEFDKRRGFFPGPGKFWRGRPPADTRLDDFCIRGLCRVRVRIRRFPRRTSRGDQLTGFATRVSHDDTCVVYYGRILGRRRAAWVRSRACVLDAKSPNRKLFVRADHKNSLVRPRAYSSSLAPRSRSENQSRIVKNRAWPTVFPYNISNTRMIVPYSDEFYEKKKKTTQIYITRVYSGCWLWNIYFWKGVSIDRGFALVGYL